MLSPEPATSLRQHQGPDLRARREVSERLDEATSRGVLDGWDQTAVCATRLNNAASGDALPGMRCSNDRGRIPPRQLKGTGWADDSNPGKGRS